MHRCPGLATWACLPSGVEPEGLAKGSPCWSPRAQPSGPGVTSWAEWTPPGAEEVEAPARRLQGVVPAAVAPYRRRSKDPAGTTPRCCFYNFHRQQNCRRRPGRSSCRRRPGSTPGETGSATRSPRGGTRARVPISCASWAVGWAPCSSAPGAPPGWPRSGTRCRTWGTRHPRRRRRLRPGAAAAGRG